MYYMNDFILCYILLLIFKEKSKLKGCTQKLRLQSNTVTADHAGVSSYICTYYANCNFCLHNYIDIINKRHIYIFIYNVKT